MKDETLLLIHKAKMGDRESLEKVTCENLGLVRSCMKRFRGRGTEEEDLFQLGCMGLVKAIQRFDDSFDTEFSTYAVPVILGEIRRFLRDDGWIKVSRSVKETARRIWEAQNAIEKETGKAPTLSQLSEIVGCTMEEVTFALEASSPAHSLEECVHGGDQKSISLGEVLPSKEGGEETILNRVMVASALERCNREEKTLIRMRYFEGKTQAEIARVLGVSQVQVSRMEKRILFSMRRRMEKGEN